jgi:hypothetical protein
MHPNAAPEKLSCVWRTFVEKTSIIGFDRIHPSPFRLQRLLWLTVVLGGFGTKFIFHRPQAPGASCNVPTVIVHSDSIDYYCGFSASEKLP